MGNQAKLKRTLVI